ncbi:hypothetical protein GHA01_25120 [Novacetimonas hansenii]|uniref:Uncharacterized protein n=1 Tax=Novacetimonas hansenii TaxID=436 RepID=A0ABQ0SHE3_NOVHA|nr:hypothetical protein Gaha_0014_002 [Novacetimonas hansenii JCM 7643]GBQ56770.1 hypothetical protein AA0243_1298 [Novacetimonas hansenii NRIC 0243]GEC64663.1 hypothetical protein GHA01_25120 [Novacetimonas hansenii]
MARSSVPHASYFGYDLIENRGYDLTNVHYSSDPSVRYSTSNEFLMIILEIYNKQYNTLKYIEIFHHFTPSALTVLTT